jgi:hypothetical protein
MSSLLRQALAESVKAGKRRSTPFWQVILNMRIWPAILLFSLVTLSAACFGTRQPATPLETFKTYVKAFKQKDTTTMKLLLSNATIKMHEQEAKAQGVTVDEIVKRETLFNETQRSIEYRNERTDGDKATLEIKNSYGSWETVPFVREDGVWKIDKKGYADQMMQDVEDNDRKFDELINANRPPTY